MRLALAILVLSMLPLCACAVKHVAMPQPVIGVDIIQVNKGDVAQFNGTEFSPYYLNQYLQWKCTDQGKC